MQRIYALGPGIASIIRAQKVPVAMSKSCGGTQLVVPIDGT